MRVGAGAFARAARRLEPATPRPVVGLEAELGPNRVVPDVHARARKVLVVPQNTGVEPVLKQVADSLVPPIETLSVKAIQLVEAMRKPVKLRLDDQVVVISHQAVGVNFQRQRVRIPFINSTNEERSTSSAKISQRATPRAVTW